MSPWGEYVQIQLPSSVPTFGGRLSHPVPGLLTGFVSLTGFDGGLEHVLFFEDPVGN